MQGKPADWDSDPFRRYYPDEDFVAYTIWFAYLITLILWVGVPFSWIAALVLRIYFMYASLRDLFLLFDPPEGPYY